MCKNWQIEFNFLITISCLINLVIMANGITSEQIVFSEQFYPKRSPQDNYGATARLPVPPTVIPSDWSTMPYNGSHFQSSWKNSTHRFTTYWNRTHWYTSYTYDIPVRIISPVVIQPPQNNPLLNPIIPPEKNDFKRASCNCGRQQGLKRIIGGGIVSINVYPWMAAIVDNSRRSICGGTLINDRYILTAAHCILSSVAPNPEWYIQKYHVQLGSNRIDGGNAVSYKIAEIKIHERYNSKTNENDIALLRLTSLVSFGNTINPICLPKSDSDFVGRVGHVAGWGKLSVDDDFGSNELRETAVEVLTNFNCANLYKNRLKIVDSMICAASPKRDSCQGDSGGPLMDTSDTNSQQIGIVSFGRGCANLNFPGVYTRITRYVTWLQEKTQDAYYCSRNDFF